MEDFNFKEAVGQRSRILKKIKAMSNKRLLKETLELAPGDDHDGYFTAMGNFKFKHLKEELYSRLGSWFKEG